MRRTRRASNPLPFLTILTLVLLLALLSPLQVQAEELAFSSSWLRGTVVVTYGSQYGTGFWINPSHVATAAHVVSNNPQAVVTVIRGSVRSLGRVVALDARNDVAVIYVDNANAFPKHIFPMARTMPPPTSTIFVIGYPHELYQVLGSIEVLSENPRALRTSLTWAANGLIELGGIVDAGNSGGPVTDSMGNVIGVVSFALRGTAGVMYFATSAASLRALCDRHGIAYVEGVSSAIAALEDNPALVAAATAAATNVVVDVLLVALGAGVGVALASKRRKKG